MNLHIVLCALPSILARFRHKKLIKCHLDVLPSWNLEEQEG